MQLILSKIALCALRWRFSSLKCSRAGTIDLEEFFQSMDEVRTPFTDFVFTLIGPWPLSFRISSAICKLTWGLQTTQRAKSSNSRQKKFKNKVLASMFSAGACCSPQECVQYKKAAKAVASFVFEAKWHLTTTCKWLAHTACTAKMIFFHVTILPLRADLTHLTLQSSCVQRIR